MSIDPFAPDTALPCQIRPSPNHGDRKGKSINSIILHYTDTPTAEAALEILCDPATQVSSHYLVDEDGRIIQLVSETRRAWHAGRSYWQGERDMNSVSVGIEIANGGSRFGLPPFPESQIEAVIALCHDVSRRHGIDSFRILAHSDIAPGRKVDPGPLFPWRHLYEAGLGRWPAAAADRSGVTLAEGETGPRVAALQEALAVWGAEVPITGAFDKVTTIAVSAFQLHFRPACWDGAADPETCALLATMLHESRAT